MSLLALQRDFVTWLRKGDAASAAQVGAGQNAGLQAYLNNYRMQLVATLEDAFPITRAWLGEDVFDIVAVAHIEAVPPASWTLDTYGSDLPAHLATLFEDAPEVAELAWLERALAEAYVGVDHQTVSVAAIVNTDWDHAILRFTPTLDIIDIRTNAAALWSAINADESPPAVALLEAPAALLVWRHEQVSCFRVLDATERDALLLARSGKSFAELCRGLVDARGIDEGLACAGTFLGRWITEGMVSALIDDGAPIPPDRQGR